MANTRISSSASLPLGPSPVLVHSRRLADRLYAFVLVRCLVSAGIVVAALFARTVVGVEDLDIRGLTLLALVLLGSNAVTWFAIRPFRRQAEAGEGGQQLLTRIMQLTIAVDFVCLAVALWLVGGPMSPFQAFFVFHVIIASVMLPGRVAYATALFGYLLLAGLAIATWMRWIPEKFPAGAVPVGATLDGRYILSVLFVQGLLFFLVAWLVTSLMKLIREGEQRLLDRNAELDRLSSQRRDFLQIALHNLRSPLAAVGMHIANVLGGYGGTVVPPQREWLERSQARLDQLFSFLRDLESFAALETDQMHLSWEVLNLSDLVRQVVEDNQDLAATRRHLLVYEEPGPVPAVQGIPRLIREAVANYVTNAIHYTHEGGEISVGLTDLSGWLRVSVTDNGIGIAPRDQGRLFQEFVRIPRGDDQPGSGLGLFIARRVAELHGGHVGVESAPGQGSTFFIDFPVPPSVAPA